MHITTYASLVFTMLLWGGTFIAGRVLAGSVAPASSAFYRFAIATIALAILTRVIDGNLKFPPRGSYTPLFFLGLTGVFSYNFLFFTGLQHLEAGRASLIIALNPLAITLFGALFFRESLNIKQFMGVLISLTGAIFVISNGHPEALFSGNFGKGEVNILGCVASWVAYSLIGRQLLKTLSPLSAVFYSALIGTCLLAIPASLDQSIITVLQFSTNDWLSLFFLGILGTAVGFSLYYQAIRTIGSTKAGVFINLVPVFSILLAHQFLGESIKFSVIIGGILVLTGVSLTNFTATVVHKEQGESTQYDLTNKKELR